MIYKSPYPDIVILDIWLMVDKFRRVLIELRQYEHFFKDRNFNGISSNL